MWQKPEEGLKKVSTDASFVLSTSSGSSSAVIRDEGGNLLMAAAKRYSHVPDALMAEALAERDGLLLAQMGGYAAILELDNLALVNLLRSVAGERSEIAGLWQEIRELSMVFNSFSVSFVKREGNEAAHTCAKLLALSALERVWTETIVKQ